jgi:rhodanese-related sulfurtransferase
MPKTFAEMVQEARRDIPTISPEEARRLMEQSDAVLVDVRDLEDTGRRAHGTIPGAVNVSAGMLAVRADRELAEAQREPRLQDRSRPVITTCNVGALASLGAKTLREMGFEQVYIMDGGTQAWKEAGLPTEGADAEG